MKRIICILLCLMMLIPVAVSQATDIISYITVTLRLPKPGTTAFEPPFVTVPAGANYEYDGGESVWFTDGSKFANKFDIMPKGAVFEAGKAYYAGLIVSAMEGHQFDSAAHISCTNANTKIVYEDIGSSDAAFIVEFTVPKEEKISLNKLKISKLTSPSKTKIKVTWKKLTSAQKKKIRKVEIQVSVDKGFKKSVITKRASAGKSSYTVKGLKKGKKYYVRIRAYTETEDCIYLSKWSAKKSITTKK